MFYVVNFETKVDPFLLFYGVQKLKIKRINCIFNVVQKEINTKIPYRLNILTF